VTGNRVASAAEGVGPYGSGDKTTCRGSGCKLASERGFLEANDGVERGFLEELIKAVSWKIREKGERRQRKGAKENRAA
jgi:hypothetical protein